MGSWNSLERGTRHRALGYKVTSNANNFDSPLLDGLFDARVLYSSWWYSERSVVVVNKEWRRTEDNWIKFQSTELIQISQISMEAKISTKKYIAFLLDMYCYLKAYMWTTHRLMSVCPKNFYCNTQRHTYHVLTLLSTLSGKRSNGLLLQIIFKNFCYKVQKHLHWIYFLVCVCL